MIKGFISNVSLKFRKVLYAFNSNNASIYGKFKAYQPVVLRGKGKIQFGKNVNFGVINSPHFHSTYAYLEARATKAEIHFGSNIHINNGFSAVSELKITIKNDVLIGYNCNITDSNFHNLDIDKRHESDPEPKEVTVESNVFIGNNVTILKGVCIGENSVVGSGCVVTKSFPKNVVIGGCPGKIIKHLL